MSDKKKRHWILTLISSTLSDIRKETGLCQRDFAEKLRGNGITASQSTVNRIEMGNLGMNIMKFTKILELFGYKLILKIEKTNGDNDIQALPE